MSDQTTLDAVPTLSAWDRVKLARHADRPHALDYVRELATDWVELHGDRSFGDDRALVGGLARIGSHRVMVLGHQKGNDTKENLARNFGMARPEGYRKAERLMRHAEKFGFPLVTFIDTPGAEPGIGSEERGQATAIAESLLAMADLATPSVAVVIGEGGSGGALAIGVADRILMLENAIYAVASPEACAAILWKDAARAPEAAETMRVTARGCSRPREPSRCHPGSRGRYHSPPGRVAGRIPALQPFRARRPAPRPSRALPPHRRLARARPGRGRALGIIGA
jgi:acetyl-CoA carboxylase carboxyl transferase subunit alpha